MVKRRARWNRTLLVVDSYSCNEQGKQEHHQCKTPLELLWKTPHHVIQHLYTNNIQYNRFRRHESSWQILWIRNALLLDACWSDLEKNSSVNGYVSCVDVFVAPTRRVRHNGEAIIKVRVTKWLSDQKKAGFARHHHTPKYLVFEFQRARFFFQAGWTRIGVIF